MIFGTFYELHGRPRIKFLFKVFKSYNKFMHDLLFKVFTHNLYNLFKNVAIISKIKKQCKKN